MPEGTGSSVILAMGPYPEEVDGYVVYMKTPSDTEYRFVDTTSEQQYEIGAPAPPPPGDPVVDDTTDDTGQLPAGAYYYVIKTYTGDPNSGYFSVASATTATAIVSNGQVVTIALPPLPEGADGFVLYRVDSTGTYTMIGTTTGSTATFTDTGFITTDNPYTPPVPPTIPDYLKTPPSVNYTGQVALTTVPMHLTVADYPKPVLNKYGRPVDWKELSESNNHVALGRLRVLVDNTDVTFLRGVQTIVHGWTDNEPFGDATCELEFPQVTSFDRLGEGDVAWFKPWVEVELQLVVAAGQSIYTEGKTYTAGQVVPLFEGLMPGRDDIVTEEGNSLRFTAVGVLYQLDYYVKPPGFRDIAEDVGKKIADAINDRAVHYGFRGTPCKIYNFGIQTRKSGAWDQLLSGYIQDLLSTTQTSSGGQATLMLQRPRTPLLKWKDTTAVHCSVWVGQPGVTHSLSNDFEMHPNVFYGEGTDESGYRWRNTKYPNMGTGYEPLYPLPLNQVFVPGGGQLGFQPFSDKMRELGYAWIKSQNAYSSYDIDEVKDVQQRRGILVDGKVGPQTWAAVFEVGSNGNVLDSVYFAPLAYDKKVMPYIYDARGAIIGPNPYWIADKVRLEKYDNYGDHVSKKTAISSAQQEYNRNSLSGWAGTITLTMDPPQMSRFLIRAGMNISLKGFHGSGDTGFKFHIAQVDRDLMSEPPTVTLTVDTKARDLMSLAAILERDRDTKNPANRQKVTRRSSETIVDNVVIWDVESGAGYIPKHAQQAGLWTVMRIPAGERGTVAKMMLRTYTPANKFAVAVFSKAVTDVQLRNLLGNPLANSSDGKNPWDKYASQLDAMGYLYAAGGPGNAAGYYPGVEGSSILSGVFQDNASWYYESDVPPWLWVAVYTSSTCYVDGRLYPGVAE